MNKQAMYKEVENRIAAYLVKNIEPGMAARVIVDIQTPNYIEDYIEYTVPKEWTANSEPMSLSIRSE